MLFSLRALPSRRCLVGYTTLPISFLADFLVRPRGVLLLLLPNLHSLSPSFQVIDVLSLRRIHQHGGILGRSEEESQEGLANNSALSSFLVLQMFCRAPSFLPSILPSGLQSHLQIWKGATAYMVPLIAKCGIIQVAPPASA